VLVRRIGYELPRTALVVRGSDLRKKDIRKTATACLTMHQVLGMSVFAADVPSVEDVIYLAAPLRSFSTLSVCRLGDLEGFEVLPTAKAPHMTVVLPSLEDGHLDDLRNRFAQVKNPLVNADNQRR
jgi:hypothetical protein